MKKTATLAAALAAAALITGCTEIAQEPGKSYAGKEDAKAYAGDQFKGDKGKWLAALSDRSKGQNEYNRMPADKK